MTNTIIYSGLLRSWEQVKENHEKNLWEEGDEVIFHTNESPNWDKKHKFIKLYEQIKEFPPAVLTNHAPETQGGYILNALNQWRNRQIAFSQVLHNTPIYVMSRTDIKLSEKLHFEIGKGKIYIPVGNDYREGINDQFAYGGYLEMRQYCGLYDNWMKFFNEGLQFHPETYLKRQLEGLEIVRIPQTNQIVRGN